MSIFGSISRGVGLNPFNLLWSEHSVRLCCPFVNSTVEFLWSNEITFWVHNSLKSSRCWSMGNAVYWFHTWSFEVDSKVVDKGIEFISAHGIYLSICGSIFGSGFCNPFNVRTCKSVVGSLSPLEKSFKNFRRWETIIMVNINQGKDIVRSWFWNTNWLICHKGCWINLCSNISLGLLHDGCSHLRSSLNGNSRSTSNET